MIINYKPGWLSIRMRDERRAFVTDNRPRRIESQPRYNAQVVKLVDTPDLGSGAARYVGSSPILGNK